MAGWPKDFLCDNDTRPDEAFETKNSGQRLSDESAWLGCSSTSSDAGGAGWLDGALSEKKDWLDVALSKKTSRPQQDGSSTPSEISEMDPSCDFSSSLGDTFADFSSQGGDGGERLSAVKAEWDAPAHFEGSCKPCKYFSRKDGCTQGNSCAFCHFPHLRGHPGTQWRPSKQKRQQFQLAISHVQGADGQIYYAEVPAWIANNPFLLRKLETARMEAGASATPKLGVAYHM